MPFGLVTAPTTFCRLVRKVLKGLDCADSFVDDILIFSIDWATHLRALRQVLDRLRGARLTANPTKCSIGFDQNLECLSHVIGESQTLRPVQSKIEAIQKADLPTTKKGVRSFLGVVGFYWRFIPNFSAVAAPPSDLTKKVKPNQVIWEESQERAFNTLEERLVGPPILKLPEFDVPFILRTDASDLGLGAILLQEQEGQTMPIAYASRKLLARERNYSVIEKECLAVVWGVAKLVSCWQGIYAGDGSSAVALHAYVQTSQL